MLCLIAKAARRATVPVWVAWMAWAGPRLALGAEPGRMLPADGLTMYAEYDGLDRHADAWKRTAAYAILGETSAGEVIADSASQAIDRLAGASGGARPPIEGRGLVGLIRSAARSGFAWGSIREGDQALGVAAVPGLGRADRPDDRKALLALFLDAGAEAGPSTPIRGREVQVARPGKDGLFAFAIARKRTAWWSEGDDLIVVDAPAGADDGLRDRLIGRIIDAIEGKAADASTAPMVIEARRVGAGIGGFEANGLFVAASTAEVLGELAGDAAGSLEGVAASALGVAGSRQMSARWGFRGSALLTVARFDPEGAKPGLLAAPGFRRDQLPAIPADAGAFVVAAPRFDGEALAEGLRGATIMPEFVSTVEAIRALFADDASRRAMGDLASTLGPDWCLYAAPGGPGGDRAVPTLVARVADPARVAEASKGLVGRLNAFLVDRERAEGADPARPPALAFEPLPGPEVGYSLTSPDGRAPWLSSLVRPTILVGEGAVAFAANPALARRALSAERRWKPEGEVARAIECLPDRLTFLVVGNPRDSSWPGAIAGLSGATAAPALARFIGVAPPADPVGPSKLMGLLGIRPAAPTGRKPPTADEVRARIFPSVVAGSADERGIEVVAVEAFPFGCLGIAVTSTGNALSITPTFAPGR